MRAQEHIQCGLTDDPESVLQRWGQVYAKDVGVVVVHDGAQVPLKKRQYDEEHPELAVEACVVRGLFGNVRHHRHRQGDHRRQGLANLAESEFASEVFIFIY